MKHVKIIAILLLAIVFTHLNAEACTIVAVSGRVTADGRPMIFKTRDGSNNDIKIKIGTGSGHVYLCQTGVTVDVAYSGYNDSGFAIVSSHSYNMPNSDYWWNAQMMQWALERCSTVSEFQYMLDTITKPISVRSNYGVMDAQGNVAIFEVNAYNYVRYDADSAADGFLVRANHSLSQDTTGMNSMDPTSIPRYLIASAYLEETILTNGVISKEDLFGLSRCLVNMEGDDLHDLAPLNEDVYTPVEFRYYVPCRYSTSAMIIQGVLPNEQHKITVAWTMLGPQVATVCVPYIITPHKVLPQKSKKGSDGHSWFCYQGQQLNNYCFVNNTTIDLAKVYNLSGTGVLQKINKIEESILQNGNELVDEMRNTGLSETDVANYYLWVDYYAEDQYRQYFPSLFPTNSIDNSASYRGDTNMEYYDLMGRKMQGVPENTVLKKSGNKAVIIK